MSKKQKALGKRGAAGPDVQGGLHETEARFPSMFRAKAISFNISEAFSNNYCKPVCMHRGDIPYHIHVMQDTGMQGGMSLREWW